MKRFLIGVLIVLVAVVFFDSCAKKVVTEPVKEVPKVEPVMEKKPQIEKPQLTEEEIFMRKSLEDVNRQGYLKKIHFDFDKYTIRDDMKPALQSNSDWLLGHGTVEIRIEGHCDERGTVEYNMALGEKRAYAAKKYLTDLGVSGAKIQVVSYGKSKPVVKGTDEDSHFQNRRDEFIITKK
ncbi:MAG: peptidoglycan-associated lipoprotein Pal [bacterium]|nr:peptidoglycan-associated lipoprotein Pal [bacterium]